MLSRICILVFHKTLKKRSMEDRMRQYLRKQMDDANGGIFPIESKHFSFENIISCFLPEYIFVHYLFILHNKFFEYLFI